MKKTFLIAVAVLTTTLFSFAQNDDNNWSGTWGGGKKVKGEGAIITQDRAISNFTGVESNISADVFIKQAAAFKVTVEGQKNVLDLMKMEVKNGLLKISFEKGYSIRYKTQLKISVEAPSFERLGMSGSGNVKVEGALTGKNLKLECSGSGDFDVAGERQRQERELLFEVGIEAADGELDLSFLAGFDSKLLGGEGNRAGQRLPECEDSGLRRKVTHLQGPEAGSQLPAQGERALWPRHRDFPLLKPTQTSEIMPC